MGYFSTTLSRLMANHTQAAISTASGISRSGIAQYASGANGISVDALGQLLQAFPSQEDQLDLVRAHLRDEIPAEVFDLIEVRTKGQAMRVQEDAPSAPWKKDLDAAIELLRVRANHDEAVRKLVLDLEDVLR